MSDLIVRAELLKSMGLADAVKYGNKDAEQQYRSYSTWMSYEIADAIWDAPAVNRWIPVEDALPEKQGRCLVTLESGQIEIRTFLFSLTQGAAPYFSGCEKVIAWMPMPDAYEPPKEDENG